MHRHSCKKALSSLVDSLLIALLFSVSCVGVVLAQGQDTSLEKLLDEVFRAPAVDVRSLRNCAYTQQTTIKDVGSMRERFDPSIGLGLEWQLVQVNGKDPTDKQLNDYEPKLRKRHPAVLNFDFIDTDSLQLLNQSQSNLLFSFELVPNTYESLNENVTHRLKIHSDTGQLLELKSVATEPFRVQPWLLIQEYESVSTFRFEEQTESSVLEQVVFKLRVRSSERTIEREVTKLFSDFDCNQLSTGADDKQLIDDPDEFIPSEEMLNPVHPTSR